MTIRLINICFEEYEISNSPTYVNIVYIYCLQYQVTELRTVFSGLAGPVLQIQHFCLSFQGPCYIHNKCFIKNESTLSSQLPNKNLLNTDCYKVLIFFNVVI